MFLNPIIPPLDFKPKLVTRLIGGRGESNTHVAEGLATAMQCFEDFQQKREPGATPQKHCILISNSPPYSAPTVESLNYSGQNAEQLANIIQEVLNFFAYP